MPLPALNWKYVGSQAFVSGIANAHDAVYTLGTAVTYANGSARTPGSGSAWTWQRVVPAGTTVAVYGEPPLNPLAMKYILGGESAAAIYTPASPDTALANVIVMGMGQSTGAFVGPWTSTNPFGSGFFTNYWNTTQAFTTSAYTLVQMWESQEACFIQYSVSGTGASSTAVFGAFLDPLTYVPGVTCQSDNRVYLMSCAGRTSVNVATWLSLNFDNGGLIGGTGSTANESHCGYILPSGTEFSGPFVFKPLSCTPTANMLTPAGEVVILPFPMQLYIAGNTGPQQYVGVTREFGMVKDTISGTVWSNGGPDLGYVVGYSTTTAGDAVLLKV